MTFVEILIFCTFLWSISSWVHLVVKKYFDKHGVHLVLRRFNWLALMVWVTLGILTFWQGYKYPDMGEIVFGTIHEKTAFGLGYAFLGITLLIRSIHINERGISVTNQWGMKQSISAEKLSGFEIHPKKVIVKFLDKGGQEHHIFKLSNSKLGEIENKIERINKKIAQHKL